MGFVTDLKGSSRLGLLVAASAATVGVIYGYDQSTSRAP
jgi:MFS transporter, SP family, galactose:H+ symporter